MKHATTVITLQEYQPTSLRATALDHETGVLLWRRYDCDRGVLAVEFPSPRTGQQWRLTSRGWAGLIRATPQLSLALRPRLPLTDLFGMLEVAYGLQSAHFLPGIVHAASLPALYERLAAALANGVLRQARQGLAGGYVARREKLPFVRGRLLPQLAGLPRARPTVLCDYESWTTDVPDNHILAWTLHTIVQIGFCGPQVGRQVRRAIRALVGQVTLLPVTAADCHGRRYDRLNASYAPLHALCDFFLAHSAPTHQSGDAPMTSFLVNMPRLYEQFVAASLRRQLARGWTLREQETVSLPGRPAGVQFTIDLVLYEASGAPYAVLDTKYRLPTRAEPASVAQVVAYAQAKNCRRAVILYPRALLQPLDVAIGDTRVQTLPFGVGQHAARDAQDLLARLTAWETSM